MRSALFAFAPTSLLFHLFVYIHRCALGFLPCICTFSFDLLVTMHLNFLTAAVAALASFGAATISTDWDSHGHFKQQSLNPRLTTVPLAARDLPTGTCKSGAPCANGACCSKTNLCGYSKDFCGDGCQHNCESQNP